MRRRNIRKTIIFVLILCISIGFAVLTATLSMNASFAFTQNSFNLYFSDLKLLNTSTVTSPTATITDDTTITYSGTFNAPGDYIEFSFYIINNGTIAGQISTISTGLTTEQESYIDYSFRYEMDNSTVNVNDIIAAGQAKRVIAHFEYSEDIDDFIDLSSLNVNLTMHFIQPQIDTTTVWNYEYLGAEQYFIVPKSGSYKLEVWGAQGGPGELYTEEGGKGGYSTGIVSLNKNDNLKVYVGQKGYLCYGNKVCDGTFGGGGSGVGQSTSDKAKDDQTGVGGGASDIRINSSSLYARVIVAGGGGGSGEDMTYDYITSHGGFGGGENGGSGFESNSNVNSQGYSLPGTQIDSPGGGAFGQGAYNVKNCGGGGGGWYGGGSGTSKDGAGTSNYGQPTFIASFNTADCNGGGAGGSGWIYTASTYNYWAENSTEGQSGDWLLNSSYYLTSAVTKSGEETFLSPLGVSETGHEGNGFVRITYVG